MLLGEPARTAYDLNFSLAGVPVRVHPLFWLIMAAIGYSPDERGLGILLWVMAGFISIVVHEFGHVLAFRNYGVSSHVVLYAMGGVAVPHSGQIRGGAPQVVISLAGPLAGFALAATILLGLRLSHVDAGLDLRAGIGGLIRLPYFAPRNLYEFCDALLFMNIYWGILNLLPILPLDGGQVSRAVLTHFNPLDGLRQSLILAIATGVGLALWSYNRDQTYMTFLFAYLAFTNFQMLQAFGGLRR